MPDPIELSDRRQCQHCAHWWVRSPSTTTGICALSKLVTWLDATCERWKKARKANG